MMVVFPILARNSLTLDPGPLTRDPWTFTIRWAEPDLECQFGTACKSTLRRTRTLQSTTTRTRTRARTRPWPR